MKNFQCKTVFVIFMTLSLVSEVLAFDPKELARRSDQGIKKPVMEYSVPDEKNIPNNQFGDLVKYGKELVVNTYKYIGPEVANEKMRYSGNNLSCQNCHLGAGTQKYSSPFIGTYASFPQYRPREDAVGTLANRINGCMQRSMNGKSLPIDSREMKAFEAYMYWLSQGIPVGGAKIEGRGLVKVDRKMINNTKADVVNGEKVYAQNCAICHGKNGEGVKNDGLANGYTFPPLWGNDSYNKGAGMFRVIKATDFIKGNMPLGATGENPILTDKEAYDVAAYINREENPRPEKANRNQDFPDKTVRPPDVYRPSIESEKNKFGPYGEFIIK